MPTPPRSHAFERALRVAIALLATVVAASGLAPPVSAAAASAPAQVEWKGVDRVIAFADVHGAYAELTALLQSVGVIDADLHWSAGKTHVVSLGDLMDRGADSRKVMDLLMRLQPEAAAAGGQLHIVLGNHEAMNVLGDLRYVDKGEFASYSAEEDPAVRAAQKAGFLARNAGSTEADFDRLFPPGFFGHRAALGPDGKYGQWLLALPAAIVINDTVYIHGGPSTVLGNRSIPQLDVDYAAALSNYLAAESELRKAGLIQYEDSYSKRPDAAQARLDAMAAGDGKAALAAAVARFKAADDDPLLGPAGPNWYRGAALCNECAEADVLNPFLKLTGVKRVVVGHTVARNGTVVTRFDGAIVKLDAGMNKAVFHGHPAALILDASGMRVAYADPTVAPAAVPAEPLYLSSQTINESDVADILARGAIQVKETCAPGVLEVRVTLDGRSVDGMFESASADIVKRELAAYRLDRLLGLGLVPATVARDYDGSSGVLQGRPADWVSEQDRQNASKGAAAGLACQTITGEPRTPAARRPVSPQAQPPRMPAGGWCALPPQFQLSYVFDALIDNRGRTFDRYLYDTDTAMMFLSGHGSAFGTGTEIPKPLESALAKTGPEMQARLRRLDAGSVKAAIGEYVGDPAIEALLRRRDRILELSGAGARR
jgi:Calcineurin-like phosphoesterase